MLAQISWRHSLEHRIPCTQLSPRSREFSRIFDLPADGAHAKEETPPHNPWVITDDMPE